MRRARRDLPARACGDSNNIRGKGTNTMIRRLMLVVTTSTLAAGLCLVATEVALRLMTRDAILHLATESPRDLLAPARGAARRSRRVAHLCKRLGHPRTGLFARRLATGACHWRKHDGVALSRRIRNLAAPAAGPPQHNRPAPVGLGRQRRKERARLGASRAGRWKSYSTSSRVSMSFWCWSAPTT